MKTLKLVPFFMIAFLSYSFTAAAQEEEDDEIIEEIDIAPQDELDRITATFIGMEDGEFVFTYKDEDGEESRMTFSEITPEAKEMYDLSGKRFKGKTFKILYATLNVADDEDEDFMMSVRSIISLDLIK